MGTLRDVFSSLLMDATPEERAKLFRFVFRVAVTVYITWAIGMYAPLGFNGVARADQVDDKIKGALQPVTAQLGAISTQIAAQDDVLRQIRADQLATKLRELKRTCCVAGSDREVKARMEQEIEAAQRAYRSLTGERYPLPECGE